MQPKSSIITTRELAQHLELAHSTVARALNNDPRISPATRNRVVKAAQKLGYRRDPKLAELMAHLRLGEKRAFQGTLAWITDSNLGDDYQNRNHLLWWPHAERRALELGYRLDLFSAVKAADAPRLARILHARGVLGVVLFLGEEFQFEEWHWDWSRCAWVFEGAYPGINRLDNVDVDDANHQRLFESLSAKGYRRIGIALTEHAARSFGFTTCAERYQFALLHPDHPLFEHCLLPDLGPASAHKVAAWIRRNRVDCVVSRMREMEELLKSIGYPPPEKIGLAYVEVRPDGLNSGMSQCEDKLAIAMVETLVANVEHGRFGIPDQPRMLSLPGVWHQGRTSR